MAGIRKRFWTDKNGKKKSCYEITYYLNGKLCRKSGYKTKIDAQNDLNTVTKVYSTNVKIEELAKLYIQNHCSLHCKQSTIQLYESYLNTRLNDIKQLRAKDFNKSNIENLVLEWKNNGAKNKTINNILIFLQSILSYGIELNLLQNNPVQKFKKLPSTKKNVRFLTDEQIPLFENIAKTLTPKYYVLFLMAIRTGMRRGELLALEWSDINFTDGKISVNKQLYNRKVTVPKTENSIRFVDMSEELANELIKYKSERKVLSKLVFCTDNGRHLHAYNMYNRYYKNVLKKLSEELPYENNVQELTFHDLRHTYATYLLSKGVPVKYVQEQLGHSSAKVTLDIYNHVMPSTKNQAFDVWRNLKYEHKMSIEN